MKTCFGPFRPRMSAALPTNRATSPADRSLPSALWPILSALRLRLPVIWLPLLVTLLAVLLATPLGTPLAAVMNGLAPLDPAGGVVLAASLGETDLPIRLVDGLGRTMTLPGRPQRIVSLAASVTEMLFAIGAGPQVVGVTKWCDYPAEATRLPKVGDMNIDLERVVALRPDLVVADAGLEPRVIAALDRLGLRTLAVAPSNLGEVLRALELLGKATGRAEKSGQVVAGLAARVAKLTSEGRKIAASRPRPLRVFALLDAAELYTAGPGTFIDELIRLAGGANIAADARAAWPLFSEEALLVRDPEVIVVTYFPREEVLRRPRWQGLSAVKAGRVFTVDPDLLSRPGPRLVDGLALLVDLLAKNR